GGGGRLRPAGRAAGRDGGLARPTPRLLRLRRGLRPRRRGGPEARRRRRLVRLPQTADRREPRGRRADPRRMAGPSRRDLRRSVAAGGYRAAARPGFAGRRGGGGWTAGAGGGGDRLV